MIIAIGIIIWLVFVFLLIRLVGAGADMTFKEADYKCKRCERYTGSNPAIRIIYCNNQARTPEECLECKGEW